jgi:hypothetical protein
VDEHGKWKKISYRKDAMRARWMWNIRQMLLGVWLEGVALPPSLSHITTESQWRSLVLSAGRIRHGFDWLGGQLRRHGGHRPE